MILCLVIAQLLLDSWDRSRRLMVFAHFAVVNGGQCVGFGNSSHTHAAVNNPVVAAFHAAENFVL